LCGSAEEINEIIQGVNSLLDDEDVEGDEQTFQEIPVTGSIFGFSYDLADAEVCLNLKMILKDGHCRFMR